MDRKLYFGTDGRYWTLPSQYRKYLNESCQLIIKDLYPKFAEYHRLLNTHCFGNLLGEDLYESHSKLIKDLSDSMIMARSICGSSDVRYYKATNLRIVACANALNAYGGAPYSKIAYLMIKVGDLIGWTNWEQESWMTVANNVVRSFVEYNPSPIVFTFTIIDDDLWNCLPNQRLCVFNKDVSEKDILHLIDSNKGIHKPEEVDRDFDTELNKANNHVPFLYHGTDARIIRMPDDERNRYMNSCHAVVNYLWQFFETTYKENKTAQYKEILSKVEDPNLYYNLLEKLAMVDMMKNGRQQYQYGDLYLTSREHTADNYAKRSFAGGEIGLIAYRMIQAAEIIGFDGLYDNSEAVADIDIVRRFSTNKNEPIVLKIRDLDPSFLQTDTGKPIDWSSIRVIPQLFRYKKKTVLEI